MYVTICIHGLKALKILFSYQLFGYVLNGRFKTPPGKETLVSILKLTMETRDV